MARIGIVSPPTLGHINPFLTLGKELIERGHTVVFFQLEEMKQRIVNAGLDFHQIGKIIPYHSMDGIKQELGHRFGLDAMRYWRKRQMALFKVWFKDLPKALEEEGVELLLVDQSDATGSSIAEAENIPFVTVCLGLDMDWEESIPPFFSTWNYDTSQVSIHRNRIAMDEFVKDFISLFNLINNQRKDLRLENYNFYRNLYPVSPLAQIAQIPMFLDYPRREKPSHFYNVGPFVDTSPAEDFFPFEKRNGKPLVYISLGTILNLRPDIFNLVGSSFYDLDVQLVISLGNKDILLEQDALPPDSIIVNYAPQRKVLSQAKLCVTHGGLNTVMDALCNGVPVLVIPISFDQPGTAARVKHHGVGELIPYRSLCKEVINRIVKKMICSPEYYKNAAMMKNKFGKLSGTESAVKIIEKTILDYV